MSHYITAAALAPLLEQVQVLDVRKVADRDASRDTLPGAHWHDPEAVGDWLGQLPVDREIVAFCVHGHAVSQGVVAALQARGLRARFLQGGIESWKASGGMVVPR